MFKRGYFAECLRLFCGVLAAIRRVFADILRRIKGVLPAAKARFLSNVVKQIDTLLEAASAAQEQATRASNANSGKPQYSLTDEQASAIIEIMNANAEVAPQVELTPENWMAEIEAERKAIEETAKANGTYLKAPNGKKTNLSPKQWVDVRTKRFKAWFGDWELANLAEYLMSDDVVAILNGEEFVKDGTPLTKKVSEFYEDNYNGKVERKGLGEVILDKRSVKDSTIHGFGKAKTAAFAAVPNIITEGRVIDEQRNWKGRNYDSVTIAAPIRIGGSNYVGIVIVLKGHGTNSNRFYLHEVVLQENLQDESFKTDNKADSHRGDIAKVMQKIFISKTNSSKIVDANGEPKVVFHRTPNKFTAFDVDKIGSSSDFGAFGRGFYFSPYKEQYRLYGKYLISAFLNVRNPFNLNSENVYDTKMSFGMSPEGIQRGWTRKVSAEFTQWLKDNGYDGVVYKTDYNEEEDVVFNPNQIKSADPVTYDDNGNVIPLSERFNPEKEDIRYSLGQPTDEDVTFDNFFERTSAIFTQITDTPTTKPDYISRSGSTYWYGEDERGKYVIRRSDHWSAIVRDEEDAETFNAKPDDFNNIASCYWALDMRTYKPQSLAPINKETVRTINYNSGSKDLNIVFNDGKTTRRRGVEPMDMRKYFELRNSGDMPAANGYVVDMVNELYSATPMPTVQTAKAYLDEFTKWSGESEQKSEQKRKLYSVQDQPTFYSNAEYAVRGIKQEKATPEQWLKMIEKSGGLKAGEDKWLGLSDWLKASDKKTLTKDEVLQYIAENDIQIEEVEYGDVEDSVRFKELYIEYNALYYEYGRNSERAFEVMLDNYGDDFGIAFEAAGDELWVRDSEAAEVFVDINSVNDTRLQYTTDGLTNKREIALVVPTIEPWNTSDNIHFGDAGEGRAVAWIRFGETTDAEDNRVLVIDEIQSKRHQEGREKGYRGGIIESYKRRGYKLIRNASDNGWLVYEGDKFFNLVFDREDRGVPSAPFEKNWAELAMKRMLRYAAENGFDKVAWTTGEQQSERYNLSKIVDYIDAERNADGTYNMNVATNDDSHYVQENNISEKRLSELVGKDIAYGIISSIENSDDNKAHIEADDMTIGGAGMKAFYDQMLPSFVRKYAKKWGATVGEVTMPDLEENNTMHSVDVTPAMRESVMQGQPKFSLQAYNGNFERKMDDCKKIVNAYAISPDVKLADSEADYIDALRYYGASDDKIISNSRGVYISGNILLNTSRITTPEILTSTILHENTHSITHAHTDKLIALLGKMPITSLRAFAVQELGYEEKYFFDNINSCSIEVVNEIISTFVGEVALTPVSTGGFALRLFLQGKLNIDDIIAASNIAFEDLYGNKYKILADEATPLLREILTAYNDEYKQKSRVGNITLWRKDRTLDQVGTRGDQGYNEGPFSQPQASQGDGTSARNTESEDKGRRVDNSLRAFDAPYLEAVERGDMETAQRMVLEAAERTGYLSDTSYQGSLAFNGAAPMANAYFDTKEQRKDAWDNGEYDGTMSLGDYADNNIDTNDLEWQLSDRGNYRRAEDYTKESIDNINNAINGGNHKITIYRAVPNSVEEGTVRNGDWVTPSRKYAEYHIELQDWVGGRIIEQEVDIDNIWWNGDDINEWGYDDGSNYGYRNTPNNRKLLAPVTYDDNGNVIPLSERFNPAKEDVRYSISESWAPFSTTEAGEIAKQMRADGALPSEIYARTGWW